MPMNPDILFFDKIADTWDESEVLSLPPKVRYILSACDIRQGHDVLDLGTGTGVLLPYIAERTGSRGSITAIDFSEGMLSRARAKYSSLTPPPRFLRSDFEEIPVEGRYDRIMLYCVYPHLRNPYATLRRLAADNLKPGGAIHIAFPCDESFINSIHKDKDSDADRLPSASELTLRLTAAGLPASTVEESPHAYIVRIDALAGENAPAS